jgi:hypothetical protein
MRFLKLAGMFIVLGCSVGLVQTDTDRPIAELIGGYLRAEFSVSGSMALWGTSPAPFDRIAGNPAMLGVLEKRCLSIEWAPGISRNLQKWMDVDKRVRNKMDGLIRDYGTETSQALYPSLSPVLAFQSNPTDIGGSFSFRFLGRRFGVGFDYAVPLSMDVRFIGTGMEVGIDSEQEIQGELKRVRMRTRAGLDAQMQFRLNRLEFGAGMDVGWGTAVGLSLTRTHVFTKAAGRVLMDGIVEISGTEYVYNDPADPRIDFASGEQNDINQFFDADFSGSAWDVRLGAVKAVSRSFQMGLTVQLPSSIRLTGTDSLVNNRIPFIAIEEGKTGGNVDDMIDPAKIDLAKLTKTERVLKTDQYCPVLSFPKAVDLHVRWTKGKIRLALGGTFYSGVVSISSRGKEKGFRLKQGIRMESDFGFAFIGGSVDFGSWIQAEGKKSSSLVLPRAHCGFRIPVVSSMFLEGLIGAEPLPIFRIAGKVEW